MKEVKLGNCGFCRHKVYRNEGWRNMASIVIEGKWICGECLVTLESATKNAKKLWNKQEYTPKK